MYYKDTDGNAYCGDNSILEGTLNISLVQIDKAEYDGIVALVNSPTPEQSLELLKVEGEPYTLNGTSYQIPFKKDDADALLQVKAAFDLGVTSTVIYFTNGVKMPILPVEFSDFSAWFVSKRNAFFTV